MIHTDITGKVESCFNSDSWSNSDWVITQLDGSVATDIIKLLNDVEGKTVRLRIEVIEEI